MCCPWTQFITDGQIAPAYYNSKHFKPFINETLPTLLASMADQKVTPESIMEAQHRVLDLLSRAETNNVQKKQYVKIAHNLSVFPHASQALAFGGYTHKEFYQQTPGFTDTEIAKIEKGEMTIQHVMETRPAVLLRPLLKQKLH